MSLQPTHSGPLLSLPKEIRSQILSHVLAYDKPLKCALYGVSLSSHPSTDLIPFAGLQPFPAIMYTNRQFHIEAKAILPKVNTLYIFIDKTRLNIYNLCESLWNWNGNVSTHPQVPNIPILSHFHKLYIHIQPSFNFRTGDFAHQYRISISTGITEILQYLITILSTHCQESDKQWELDVFVELRAGGYTAEPVID